MRFSLVVPTRDRADTLLHALRSCLDQDHSEFEVLVSDNSDGPETRRVVDELGDRRLRYLRPESTLCMSDNWEFALSHAKGEFVCFIGDDDGLLPQILGYADRLLRTLGCAALRWNRAVYTWPSSPIRNLPPHRLRLPLAHEFRTLDRNMIPKVANNALQYGSLPNPYPGMVHRRLFDDVRKTCGRVFGGYAPDLYSGYVLAYAAKSWVSIGYPLSLVGISGRSNGVALVGLGLPAVGEDFRSLNANASLVCHRKAPNIPALSPMLADMFFWAKEHMFPHERRYQVNREALAARSVAEIPGRSKEQWLRHFEAVRKSMEDDPRLLRWFDRNCHPVPPDEFAPPKAIPLGYDGRNLVVDASLLGVTNVADAASLAKKILGPPPTETQLISGSKRPSLYRRSRTAARILLKGV